MAEETPDKIITLPIDPDAGVTAADAGKLCDALELEGAAREDGMKLFPILYTAFMEKDMSLLEVNPLIVMKDGRVRVLDAKVSFDGNALFRHDDIMALRDETEEDAKEIEASKYDLAYVGPRRRYRLHGQRRGPRHGDHWTSSSSTARSRRTSLMSAVVLPRRR